MDDLIIELPDSMFEPAAFLHKEGTFSLPVMRVGCDEYRFSQPISWNVNITNTGEAITILGRAQAQASVPCARCLDPAHYNLDAKIDDYLLLQQPEDEEDEGEFEVLPDDHKIDLGLLIEVALRMEAPLTPLCKEDCKGICQHCGANLNSEECSCAVNEIDETNPFSVLKDFKFEE